MRLNKKKTLCMLLGKHKKESPLTIGGDTIGTIKQYKYLGTLVDNKLDMDVHWEHVSNGFNSTLYLLKTLRQLGFNQRVLVNVFKSLISSQVVANATTLCSVSESAKRGMLAIEKRSLKIMNIKESDLPTLNIKDIDDLINERCIQQMDKILADSDHPITLSLHKRNTGTTRNTFPFVIPRCNTSRHQNSFVPKFTRQVEDKSSKPSTTSTTTITTTTKPKTTCPTYGKSFIRLKMHQRVHAKANSALTETHFSTLPDFNNNYEHVTTRKTFQNSLFVFNYNHYFCLTPL